MGARIHVSYRGSCHVMLKRVRKETCSAPTTVSFTHIHQIHMSLSEYEFCRDQLLEKRQTLEKLSLNEDVAEEWAREFSDDLVRLPVFCYNECSHN